MPGNRGDNARQNKTIRYCQLLALGVSSAPAHGARKNNTQHTGEKMSYECEYTKDHLQTLTTGELRKLVRDSGIAKGTVVAGLNKANAIQTLLDGRLPGTAKPEDVADVHKIPHSESDEEVVRKLMGVLKGGGLNEAQVLAIADQSLDARFEELVKEVSERVVVPTTVRIERETEEGETESEDLGLVHHSFETVLKMLKGGLNVYLHGPTGTGKTHTGELLAKALGVEFYSNGRVDTEYKLLGFIDANGVYHETEFIRAWRDGGVYLFDELDDSDTSACTAFNGALSNGYVDSPIGRIYQHAKCYIVGGGNTTMRGEMVGGFIRREMDTAFRERFAFVYYPTDLALEQALVPSAYCDWLTIARTARHAIEKHGVYKVEASMRCVLQGVKLLDAGFTIWQCVNHVIRRGLFDAEWEPVAKEVREASEKHGIDLDAVIAKGGEA